MTSDETIGQVLVLGWTRENLAENGQKVHGCIVAGDYDDSYDCSICGSNTACSCKARIISTGGQMPADYKEKALKLP
jgi:hypothetical protein